MPEWPVKKAAESKALLLMQRAYTCESACCGLVFGLRPYRIADAEMPMRTAAVNPVYFLLYAVSYRQPLDVNFFVRLISEDKMRSAANFLGCKKIS